MINELDESLKELLLKKAGLNPTEVEISFDVPTKDWSAPVTRPTINIYLYDVHENIELRDLHWQTHVQDSMRAGRKRPPRRMNLSYMVTCWTSAMEDQHRLLWRVLETFMRYSPLPEEVLQGSLKNLLFPIQTKVAQPDSILKNPSDFWGALENQIRPAISVIATLELDLDEKVSAPMVFVPVFKIGQQLPPRQVQGITTYVDALQPGWEGTIVKVAGIVIHKGGAAVPDAAVRLIGKTTDGQSRQFGPTVQTDANGHYIFRSVPPGEYTLVVEVAGQAPQQQPLTLALGERGAPLPELVHQVEVPL
ncbi:MAG: Pvc16 family protein [Anaerolineae bacterium]